MTDDEQPFDDALADALQARAAEVSATPSDEARSGVERRIRQRVRARRQRRALVSATSAVAAVAVVVGAVALVGNDDEPDLAIENHDTTAPTTTAPPVLQPDQSGSDPADFGLPRIGFAASLDLQAQNVVPEEVQTALIERFFDYTQIQSFRPEGQAVPVIYAPWPAPAPEPPGTPNDRPVRVGDSDGTLHGEERGWMRLTWALPDGTDARLMSYGVPSETLTDFAADLRVEADGVGYETGPLPPGFSAETAVAPPDDAVAAKYDLELRSSDARLAVTLAVNSDSREQQAERLIVSFMSQTTGEGIEVMGKAGILLEYNDGSWAVAWPPTDGVTALMTITGATSRAEVEEIVDGLRVLSAEDWNDALAGG